MLEAEKDGIRRRFVKYTRQAFLCLPRMVCPRVLDVGCGSGVPTLELAKLSGGEITGIDVDQSQLNRLNQRIQEEGLSDRVFVKNCSLFDINFPDETFDILWAEGSLHIIGFVRGLRELRRLLKPRGFLVVHDGVTDVSAYLGGVPELGYVLVNSFMLPDNVWWTDYFEPLEQLIKEWREKVKSVEGLRILERYQNEANMFKLNPEENVSAFYIFQKK